MVRYDLNLFEVWKPIPGFPWYEVSSEGRVWSIRNKKYLKPAMDRGGYLWVKLCNNGIEKSMLIHRLVMDAFVNNPDPDRLTQINHKNEDKTANMLENLEYCDARYNSNYGDRVKKIHDTKLLKGQISGLSKEEYVEKWRNEHKEDLHNYWVNYRKEHREKLNEYKRLWRQNKKEEI